MGKTGSCSNEQGHTQFSLVAQCCLTLCNPMDSRMPFKIFLFLCSVFCNSLAFLCPNKTVQFSSVAQLCLTLCNPMNHRMPGLPVHHQLPESAQTHCPLSWWCHPTISSSVVPFSSCLQSFPASWSFQISQFFASGGQSIGVSASVLPMNTQDWSPLGWTG